MLRMLRREYHYVIHNHSGAKWKGDEKSGTDGKKV